MGRFILSVLESGNCNVVRMTDSVWLANQDQDSFTAIQTNETKEMSPLLIVLPKTENPSEASTEITWTRSEAATASRARSDEDEQTTDDEIEVERRPSVNNEKDSMPNAFKKLSCSIEIQRAKKDVCEKETSNSKNNSTKKEQKSSIYLGSSLFYNKGKRKFGDRMTLSEAWEARNDFDYSHDYVDFLNSKMKNMSIKFIGGNK